MLCLIVCSATIAEDLANASNNNAEPVLKNSVLISGSPIRDATPNVMFPMSTHRATVKVAVVDSQGNLYSTIWDDLNLNWSLYGTTRVVIDYVSLNKEDITYAEIAATGANALHISCAGPYADEYTLTEVDAITDYVKEGHGLIITYHSLNNNNSMLAPLVGLSSSLTLDADTYPSGIQFSLQQPGHPVLNLTPDPYISFSKFMATPGVYPNNPWPITTGTVIAESLAVIGSQIKEGVILANDMKDYRGVFFSHYIDNAYTGHYPNADDRQTIYNAMVWAAEKPTTLFTDIDKISASTGGKANFTLDAGVDNSNRLYFILGSITGDYPGIPFPNGSATLPLNWDLFTKLLIDLANLQPCQHFYGLLDSKGKSKAIFDTLGPIPGASGLTMSFAYALLKPLDFASSLIEIEITP